RPEVVASFGIDQLHVDPKEVATTLHRPFEHVADVQLTSEPHYVDCLTFEVERGVARNHERAIDPRQVGGQALGHAIAEVVFFGIASDVCERENNDGHPGSGGWQLSSSVGCRVQANGIGPHRVVDVLEVLLTQIGELNADLASDLIVGSRRDADAARLCDAFKPRSNVNSVAEDVVGFNDYVTDIDAHAEYNAPL